MQVLQHAMSMNNNLPMFVLLVLTFVCHRYVTTFTMIPLLPRHHRVLPVQSQSTLLVLQAKQPNQADDPFSSDESLLKTVTRKQLESLCDQLKLPKTGTKVDLLRTLRAHSQKEAQSDHERNRSRAARVQRGLDESDGKARHTIVPPGMDGEEKEDDDLDGFFYFSLPTDPNKRASTKDYIKDAAAGTNTNTNTNTNTTVLGPGVTKVSIEAADIGKTQSYITAPPPPPGVQPNANGERTVTIFSSSDQNDLTGVVAAQNSATGNADATTLGSAKPYTNANTDTSGSTLVGGPFGDQSGSLKRKASEKETEHAVEQITELVQNLLAMTGAPGFQDEVLPMEQRDDATVEDDATEGTNVFCTADNFGFVGFDPARVPIAMLMENSKVLRISNGEALRTVLNDFEMRSIGLDGRKGDDTERGGGHYLEVRKVSTFLEGFRKAEVRKVARETATMLLDKLVVDGVKGLDEMLMAMTRGSEDSSDAGELNDSLVLYLEDAIRQQEKKVGNKIGNQGIKNSWQEMGRDIGNDGIEDDVSNLWNVTTGDDGELIESIDPNDPTVKQTLERQRISYTQTKPTPSSLPVKPAEQLLVLITLLKERVKAEAIFSNDERGRNLRVLAYCLHAGNEKDRETIITDNFGSSLGRLDSFSQLLTSSIDYAESTSYQLQPSKSAPLDIGLLNNIKSTVEDIKETQAWKASGISEQEQSRLPS